MSDAKGPFSNFTINRSKATSAEAPTLRGRLTVIDVDGTPIEYEHATWGPTAPRDGQREYYGMQITPLDPALAARQSQIQNGKLGMPAVPNAPTGVNLDKLGRGVLFETSEEERKRAEAAGKKVRTYFGSALVLLPSGPRAVDLATRFVLSHNFHSGWASFHDPEAAASARADKAKRPAATRRDDESPAPRQG